MATIGITQDRIDQIELRLVGADHRPWTVHRGFRDENGRPIICKSSRKACKKAMNSSMTWSKDHPPNSDDLAQGIDRVHGMQANVVDPHLMVQSLALFKLCTEANEDMAEFVANAPQDVEDLLAEVKRLRVRLREVEVDRDEMKKEMLSARVERAATTERLSDLRKAMRLFGEALKGCQQ